MAISIKFIGLNNFWPAILGFVLARAEVFHFLIFCFVVLDEESNERIIDEVMPFYPKESD